MSRRRHDPERLRAALIDVELADAWRIIPSRFVSAPLSVISLFDGVSIALLDGRTPTTMTL